MGPAISDYNMRLILLSVIQLSGGHCIRYLLKHKIYYGGLNLTSTLQVLDTLSIFNVMLSGISIITGSVRQILYL